MIVSTQACFVNYYRPKNSWYELFTAFFIKSKLRDTEVIY
jgi:hypothetical protein